MSGIMSGARIIARVLKEEGIDATFGVMGGQFWSVLHAFGEQGIRVYHMHSEYSAGFAADAYARCLRRPAVTFNGGSPGITNMVSPVAHAKKAFSPIIGLVAQHAKPMDKMNPRQELDAPPMFNDITKWSYCCDDWSLNSFWLRKACRDTMMYPQGSVLISFPNNVILAKDEEDKQLRDAVPRIQRPQPGRSQGDPVLIEKAVRMLLDAERPLAFAGDPVYWSDAANELREFVELFQCPVQTRRMARGAVSEEHPLAFTGGQRQALLDQADVIFLVGLHASQLEEWFEPPIWNHGASYLQVHESAEDFFVTPPTEIAVVGCTKLVLKQMVDCAKTVGKGFSKRTKWLEFLAKTKENSDKRDREGAERCRNRKPIHPNILGQELVDFLDPSATIILDSFTASLGFTDRIRAKFAGQVLDTALHQSVGNGIGMAVGAQLARPGKQVLVIIGDGGLGIGGMDIESLLKWNLPAVVVVFNNSSWGGASFSQRLFWPKSDPWDMMTGIRYDKMYKVLGCHSEHAEDAREIRPALERAFNSGITSVVHVVGDADFPHPVVRAIAISSIWSLDSLDDLSEEARAQLRRFQPRDIRLTQQYLRNQGLFVPLEDLARICERSLDEL